MIKVGTCPASKEAARTVRACNNALRRDAKVAHNVPTNRKQSGVKRIEVASDSGANTWTCMCSERNSSITVAMVEIGICIMYSSTKY